MKRVLLLGGLLLLVGCGGADDPSPDPSTTSTSSTSTTSEPTTSEPVESSPPPTGEGVPIAAYTAHITRSDANEDATKVQRCAEKVPPVARCMAQVDGLTLSAQALVFQFNGLGPNPPVPEIADLVDATVASAQAVYDAGTAYMASCPEAGATSEQCAADLVAFADGPAADLIATVALWDEYL